MTSNGQSGNSCFGPHHMMALFKFEESWGLLTSATSVCVTYWVWLGTYQQHIINIRYYSLKWVNAGLSLIYYRLFVVQLIKNYFDVTRIRTKIIERLISFAHPHNSFKIFISSKQYLFSFFEPANFDARLSDLQQSPSWSDNLILPQWIFHVTWRHAVIKRIQWEVA